MAELFNIQLETDLSEFDSTVTDGGDLSQSGAAALAGTSGGLSCLIDDTTAIYGQKNQAAPVSNQIRYRFYIDPNIGGGFTIANGDAFYILKHRASAPQTALQQFALSRTAGGTLRLYIKPIDDGNSLAADTADLTDAEHYVEVDIQRASSNVAADGQVRWWLDGVLEQTWNNVDNYDVFGNMTSIQLGAMNVDVGTSGTFYLDELKANDDGSEIGPVSAADALPMAMSLYRFRRV